MADHGIVDNAEKYWVLREFWPNNDMSAYILCTAPEDRNFRTLRTYLLQKDGVLPRVLLPKKQFNSISGCDLNSEVSRWIMELENKETLYKFLYLHLIPTHLKTRVSSSLSLGLADFKRSVMDCCDADLRKTRDASKEVRYFNRSPRNQQFQPQRRNEPSMRQDNYGYREPRNAFENNQLRNYGNRRYRNQVNDDLCYRHRTQGYNAVRCDRPDTCPMRDVIAPYQPKNGLPSSSQ